MVSDEPQVITELPEDFKKEFAEHLSATIPREKVVAELRQAQLARIMAADESIRVEGLGQLAMRIDSRLYFRMRNEAKKHGSTDNDWLMEYAADNPHLCAKGFRPKSNSARHGHTFVGGESVSKTKGRVQL
tara:strand:- start:22 stop:414 length:393 start_codon:yes stop_codon:yes gene_type:complete